MTLTLYDYFRSSASYRVRIALKLKKLDYNSHPINLIKDGGEQLSDFYKKINPQALVPALDVEGNILAQSLAIIEYLEEVFPTPALLPDNPIDKAYIRRLADIICCDIHPLNNLRVLNYLKENFNMDDNLKKKWYGHWIVEGFKSIENLLQEKKSNGKSCFGETPTLADICLIPQVYNAKRFEVDLSEFTLINKIYQRCLELPEFEGP